MFGGVLFKFNTKPAFDKFREALDEAHAEYEVLRPSAGRVIRVKNQTRTEEN